MGGPFDELVRNLRLDEVMREPQRHAENQQHPAHQQAALGHHARHIFKHMQITMHHRGDEKGEAGGQRRRFDRRGKPAEQGHQRHHRQQQFPFRPGQGLTRLAAGKFLQRRRVTRLAADAPPRREHHEEHAGKQTTEKHLLHRDAVDIGGPRIGYRRSSDDGIQNHRQARWKQEAQRSRAGQQPQGVAFRITGGAQNRQQQSAQRQDGDAGGTRKRGEERADQGRDNRRPATERTEPGLKYPDKSARRTAFRQEISGQREQGNGRQGLAGDHGMMFEWNRGNGQLLAPK